MHADPFTPAQKARLAIRQGQHKGVTHGLAMGYVQCNLVILRKKLAFDFLLYCQRNPRACPVLEVTDPGDPEPKRIAPGADLRTDLPRYAIYRNGLRLPDETNITGLWEQDFVSFLIGSGISFDDALERAGVPTDKHRWVLRTKLPTTPAGPFHGNLIVTMRWLKPHQAIIATQITARFPLNHGAPIHIGDPDAIGADLKNPILGPSITSISKEFMPVFWACGVTPQSAAETAGIDLMIAHAPGHGFITDLKTEQIGLP